MSRTAEEKTMAQYASFRQAVRSAKHPVALAGAGLSAASGIPTFRGAGGLWRQYDSMSLATPQAFQADPSKVWQFYHYRREVCLRASPNQAHLILANLSTEKVARQVFPLAKNGFHFITQNVDGLSIRAGDSVAELHPKPPIEMHGSLFRVRCTRCRTETSNFDSPIAKSLSGTEDVSRKYKPVEVADLPRCPDSSCGGLMRPGVVWFGESIPALSQIQKLLKPCDLLLVLGTSSTVYPAASFAAQVQAQGGKAAVFNLEEAGENADWFFEGGVEQTLLDALQLEDVLSGSQL